jgi:hypothetical protein
MNLFVLFLLIVAAAVWVGGKHMMRGRRLPSKTSEWINAHPNILALASVVALLVLLCLGIFGILGAIYGATPY